MSSAFFFQLRATIDGKRSDLKPGTYTLREDMAYTDALAALEKGPPPNTIQVRIPEGRSRGEIAESIGRVRPEGRLRARDAPVHALNPRRYGARRARRTSRGSCGRRPTR